jgi:hypothetical protein
MNGDAAPGARKANEFVRALCAYRNLTGQPASLWLLFALLNLGTQAVLFYEMAGPGMPGRAPGEYGIFNAALGIIGLLAVPASALPLALRYFFMRSQSTRLDALREAPLVLTETFTWVWGACCLVLILLPWPLPALPRFALEIFLTLNVLLTLGAIVSGAVCAEAQQLRLWALLAVTGCLARLALGGWITAYQPSAEAALAAFVAGGFITLAPALRSRDVTLATRLRVGAAALDTSFLRFVAATLSVLLGIYLFTNADRIVALSWLNIHVGETTLPSVPAAHFFDVYQATGLLARGLLWGTQPLLWIFYSYRAVTLKTTVNSLFYFWIYLLTLLAGSFALGVVTHFGALDGVLGPMATRIGPTLAAVMIPLGLLQGLGIFALASQRYLECHLIGALGILYTVALKIVGSQPQTMLTYMFGASMVALMMVLLVGVIRYARKSP